MAFDVFNLREHVVGEYRDYVESFIRILDPAIDEFVRKQLDGGELWPDAVLQLNPAYEPVGTLQELASAGTITRETARFFGGNLQLHRHQREALEIAQRREPYLVSTGTGSGKSLTYLLPIVDQVFRDHPERPGVRAIIVYPMNALINSQLEALQTFRERNWPDTPLRFARYTGQEKEEQRKEIIANPPHILLTNYMMLEYMLVRPAERSLIAQMTNDLRFLVLDELHVYRGRQGADVAMLMRRIRQRASQGVQVIGTSATIASKGHRGERRQAIAEVGSTLFGVQIPGENVIDETLRRVARVPVPATESEIRAAVQLAPPTNSVESVTGHPLAAWVEETFGLATEDGRLVRRQPLSFNEGVDRLVEATGLDRGLCSERLQAVLEQGYAANPNAPVFAFRLHQFLSSGSSVYATLDEHEERVLTMEGQVALPEDGEADSDRHRRMLFPLAFCRDCGQEHYLVSMTGEGSFEQAFIARSPLINAPEVDLPGTPGFLVLDPPGQRNDDGDEVQLWQGDLRELPEFWIEERKAGPKVKKDYQRHLPVEMHVRRDGTVASPGDPEAVRAWWMPRPLLICLRCRAAYDRRAKSDFSKLATLSQTGRSTATTVLTYGTIGALREANPDDRETNKVLSFTDNRQDASLQAGHLNDFAQVTLMRGALARALRDQGELRFSEIGRRIQEALAPQPDDFMREAVESGPGFKNARDTIIELLTYRAFEDLRRAWRVSQPNLEQVGQLRVAYDGLEELAAEEVLWKNVPAIGDVNVERRIDVLTAVLDHLRGELAIDADCLKPEATKELVSKVSQWLKAPWVIDRTDVLRTSVVARLPGVPQQPDDRATVGTGAQSALGRYLRSRHTWGRAIEEDLSQEAVEEVVNGIAGALTGHILTEDKRKGERFGVQIKADAIRWTVGDGTPRMVDPVRSRALHLRRAEHLSKQPNAYFDTLYGSSPKRLAGIVGREHTGQVSHDHRIEREEAFRAGKLPALFCSPTMELGVDISTLNVVHMRNMPPTPANYAQRSGRAGRNGRPALVVTFASQGNAHDTCFFRRKERMITGVVTPARMDITNQELVQAHLQAVWLAAVGLPLGNAVDSVIDLDDPKNLPLIEEVRAQLELTPVKEAEVVAAFREIISADPRIAQAPWFSDEWLVETVDRAGEAFDRAFDRWRELYRTSVEQRDEARKQGDRPRATKEEKRDAERMEQEAKREIALLLNTGSDYAETDFYPYRYLATEGFLPGYNFPRLPLRTLVSVHGETRSIDRPRFLGLNEFGPWNVIYHEGRKHRVTSLVLPTGSLESRITAARLCQECGHIQPDGMTDASVCDGCGVAFDAETSKYPQRLLEQSTSRARAYDRISSDEEDRSREGYEVTTHYRFAPGDRPQQVTVVGDAGEGSSELMRIEFAPRAELWRINHGWRRSVHQRGFSIDPDNGWWSKKEGDEIEQVADDESPVAKTTVANLRPYVTDNRNLLFIRPVWPLAEDEGFIKTLAVALQRGIQEVYQVEEQEVAVELIGRGQHQRLLLWEAAEGGTGVWERMMGDSGAIAAVAREALRIMHFTETGGADPEWAARCGLACYDCLLSYSNQRDHRLLDRASVRDFLLALAGSTLQAAPAGRTSDEQLAWLLERVDPASSLEREFLVYLHSNGYRLPDEAQARPSATITAQPDFLYERSGRPGVCVFVDGAAHQGDVRAGRDVATRDALTNEGFRVIVIEAHRPLGEQIAKRPEVFGSGDQ
jgi:superfamily II DNA/RNA helicase